MGFEQDIDVDLVPASQSKPNRKRKSTAGTRRVNYSWNEEEILRLISSVEQHRGLWDVSAAEYKMAKLDAWRLVADELAIDAVDATEAKTKWLSLRTTFMTNLAALRKKKSGQGANESYNVTWKFFKAMMFLKANNLEQSTLSTSTLHLASAGSDRDIVDQCSDFSQPSTSQGSVNNTASSTINRRKRHCSETPSPSPSGGSCSTSAIAILNSGVTALNSPDANSTFCDNLLAELRTLPVDKARCLRYKLGRNLIDFMEKFHDNVEREREMEPVQYVIQYVPKDEPNVESPTLRSNENEFGETGSEESDKQQNKL